MSRRLLPLGSFVLFAALALPRSATADGSEKGRSEKEPVLHQAAREVKDTGERAARKLEERGPKLPREVGRELEKAARKVEKTLKD